MTRNYYLEYTIFEQRQRVKLDFGGSTLYEKGFFININKMRLFYLFSLNRKGIHDYI
jgi:LMBR1 domain-containing protein 1